MVNRSRRRRSEHHPKLRLEHVTKQFAVRGSADTFTALDDVGIDLAAGEFLVLVGPPSGCGKSTLLDLLGGLSEPTSGRILLDGRPISGPGLDRGIVFQQYALLPWRTARANIEFGLEAKGLPKKQRRALADHYLELVGLAGFGDRYPHELSGGMKQRVAIARSLAFDPEVLLMDEPFAALDAQTRESLQDELLRIWRETGKTILFITHGIDEAIYLGNASPCSRPAPPGGSRRSSTSTSTGTSRTSGPVRRSASTGTRSGRCCIRRSSVPATSSSAPQRKRWSMSSPSATLTRPADTESVVVEKSVVTTDPAKYRRAAQYAGSLAWKVTKPTVAIAVFLVLWEIAPAARSRRRGLPAALSTVLGSLVDLITSGQLADHLGASLSRALVGFSIALLVAIPLGVAIGWYRPVAEVLNPILELFRNTAALALLPVFVLILGIGGETSKIAW